MKGIYDENGKELKFNKVLEMWLAYCPDNKDICIELKKIREHIGAAVDLFDDILDD